MSHTKIANDSNTTRIAVLETTIYHIHETLERMDKRFDKIDEQFKSLTNEVRECRKESWSQFQWLISLYIGGFGALFATIAHGLHWL